MDAFKEWFALRHAKRWYGRRRRVRVVPPADLAVAEAALVDGGPIADQFVAQLRGARHVWRRIDEDGTYGLDISTTIPVRGAPRGGWLSRPLRVCAEPNARLLEIELYSSIAGIIELRGRALDGQPWPTDWSVSPHDLAAIRSAAPWMDLPTPDELREQRAHAVEVIETWLGDPGILRTKRSSVVVEPPAPAFEIEAFMVRERFDELPAAYRDLLTVANGFEIGSVVVLGTNDAYRLDIPGPDRLVISPPDERGAIVLSVNGDVRFVGIDDETSAGKVRAPDLREWTRRRVRARTKPTSPAEGVGQESGEGT